MLLSRPKTHSHLLPLLRYRDVGLASEWLCDVFGFQPHFAAKAPDGAVFYAELRLNESMVMLGSAGHPDPNAAVPADIAIDESLGCYIVVEDVDAHYLHAKASGALIEFDLRSDATGGRGYSCRDLEGHVWNFGTYDPWTLHASTQTKKKTGKSKSGKRVGAGLGLAMMLTLMLSVASGWIVYEHVRGPDNALSQHIRKVLRQAMRAVTPNDTGPQYTERQSRSGRDLATGAINRDGLPPADEQRELDTVQALRDSLEQARKTVAALSTAHQVGTNTSPAEIERRQTEVRTALAAARKDAEAAQQALLRARQDKMAAQANARKAAIDVRNINSLLEKERLAKKAAEDHARRTQHDAKQRVAALREEVDAQAALLHAARADSNKAVSKRSTSDTANNSSARSKLKQALARAEEAEDKVTALEGQVAALKADKTSLKKTVEEANTELALAKREREAALEALADAGAKIAALQVDLKSAKTSASRASARAAHARARERARAKARKKKQAEQQNWPFTQW